jgi:hypothetical protein
MPDAKEPRKAEVVRFRPESIRDTIYRLALSTSNIAWSRHALERMTERGITDRMAVEVLRLGSIKGPIEGGKHEGEWKAKLAWQMRGRREIGVVVVLVRNSRLFVKTVEWEDLT